jgi:hypothetical protein
VKRMLWCSLAYLLAGSCTGLGGRVLEVRDVQFFKVEVVQGVLPLRLKISGLAFQSAMSVTKITTKTDGHSIVILVHLGLAKKGTSGSFEYALPVPDEVNEVRFGNDAVIVWRRVSKGDPAM